MKKSMAKEMLETLRLYKQSRNEMDKKIIENENWFKGDYWQYIKGGNGGDGSEPTTPFIFNACWNKHADAMDNYPEPVFLEREASDRAEAESLSKIVPLVLEKADFEKVYSDVWWYKLKQGAGVYGILWDNNRDNGQGDIAIKKIDLLRFYCEPNIEDIQDSRFLFVLSLADTATLQSEYKNLKIKDDAINSTSDGYFGEYSQEALKGKTLVIDCYEKSRNKDGDAVVHLTKLAGEEVLYSTRNDKTLSENGLYDHGKYPFVIDKFIPIENSVFGMGLIDVAKGTQAYIDKLDYLIERNCIISGKPRWLVKNASGINKEALMDMSVDVVPCDTAVDDGAIRPVQASPIPNHVMIHRQNKISELKEVIGNRDFTQGGTIGGVTAYGAITALQETGAKLSRDNIKESYRVFHDIAYFCVELIRQFYDAQRNFRILGKNGDVEYLSVDKNLIKSRSSHYKSAIFDIRIVPQRKNPFNTISHNQLILDLMKMGAFTPQMAESSAIALDAMILDNKDEIIRKLKVSADSYDDSPYN